ncbi:MAG: hypothetical protein AAGE18_01460 [Pseudomonadota bacterium]
MPADETADPSALTRANRRTLWLLGGAVVGGLIALGVVGAMQLLNAPERDAARQAVLRVPGLEAELRQARYAIVTLREGRLAREQQLAAVQARLRDANSNLEAARHAAGAIRSQAEGSREQIAALTEDLEAARADLAAAEARIATLDAELADLTALEQEQCRITAEEIGSLGQSDLPAEERQSLLSDLLARCP